MSDTELILLYIESSDGQLFECKIPADTPLSTVAADFFEDRGWPTTDSRGRGQRAVIERVDPTNPNRTKRLRGELTLDEAGLEDGAILRIFPEAIAGPDPTELLTDTLELIRRFRHELDIRLDFQNDTTGRVSPAPRSLFRGRTFQVEPDLCFIVMPFAPTDLNVVYQDHVRPTLSERCGLRVERGDDIYSTQAIIEDIWSSINRARLIVAELTGRNPNVFYEVGMCHTLGKDVVMLTQNMDDVPFDLRHLRVITYQYTPRGCKELEGALEKTVSHILRN